MATTVDLVPVRRGYYDGRYGQLHVRVAGPGEGQTAKHHPVVCLHQSPKSSRQMTAVLQRLGTDRLAYAPDFPGFGQSDGPTERPTIEDYAASVGDLLDALGHTAVDLYGYHTGAMNAVELAYRRPQQIRRLVLIGVPLLSENEQLAIREAPWPVPVKEDGSHLMTEWQRAVAWAGPGQTLAMVAEGFADKLLAGDTAHWGALAAADYDLADTLGQIRQPILVIGPKDDNWDNTPRAQPLLRNGRVERWPEYGFGVMDVAPDRVVAAIRGHLDDPA